MFFFTTEYPLGNTRLKSNTVLPFTDPFQYMPWIGTTCKAHTAGRLTTVPTVTCPGKSVLILFMPDSLSTPETTVHVSTALNSANLGCCTALINPIDIGTGSVFCAADLLNAGILGRYRLVVSSCFQLLSRFMFIHRRAL